MIVVRRRTPSLFDQRRQRPSAASASIESANSQFPQIRDPFFRNLGIERPLKPLKRAEAADSTEVINEVINRFHHRTDRPQKPGTDSRDSRPTKSGIST